MEFCLCSEDCGCSNCMPLCSKCNKKHHTISCPKESCQCRHCKERQLFTEVKNDSS